MGKAARLGGMLDGALLKPCGGCARAEGVLGRLLAAGTDCDAIHSPRDTMQMFGAYDSSLRKEDPYNDETWHTGDNWQTPVTYGLRGAEPSVGLLGDFPWKIAKDGTPAAGILNLSVFFVLAFGAAWALSHITKHGASAVGHVATGVEHAARGKKAWRSAS